MSIAVIRTGGKQYVVAPGQRLKVEKIDGKEGGSIKLDTLLRSDASHTEIGKPEAKEKVSATILRHARHEKIRVVKYKSKTRYRRVLGHRQHFTELQIEKFA